jgi:hypothetical protein
VILIPGLPSSLSLPASQASLTGKESEACGTSAYRAAWVNLSFQSLTEQSGC